MDIIRNLLRKIEFVETLKGIENISLDRLSRLEEAFNDHVRKIEV